MPQRARAGGEFRQLGRFTVVVERKSASADRKAGQIAERAHGVVTHAELRRAEVSEGEIRQRLKTGALLRRHPGVYRVGHAAPSIEADYIAAVKACGDEAMLSGLSAAYLHGLLTGKAVPRPEVTAPTKRRVKGITNRRSRHLDPQDRTTHKEIPLTTVARNSWTSPRCCPPMASPAPATRPTFATTPNRQRSKPCWPDVPTPPTPRSCAAYSEARPT